MDEVKRILSERQETLVQSNNRIIKGFFNLGNSTPVIGEPNCFACGLHKKCQHPKMNYTGEGRLNTLLIAEAPGSKEDELGIQLIGESGTIVRETLKKFNIDLEKDFWKVNAVNCRPTDEKGSNRTPTPKEIEYCRPIQKALIKKLNPQFIILAGGSAIESFFGDRKWSDFRPYTIGRYRRLCIPDPDTNAWVLPIVHPSYFTRNPDAKEIFVNDMRWAVSCLSFKPPVFDDEKSKVTVVSRFDDAIDFLNYFSSFILPKSIDYETNCLRPYQEGNLLLTMAVSFTGKEAFAFPYEYPGYWTSEQREKIKKLWVKNVLFNGPLVAHSVPMEEAWNQSRFGNTSELWHSDTLLRAHVIDTRDNYVDLNFQTYINFGTYGYDTEITPHKKPKKGFHFNSMAKISYHKLGQYNGMDAMFTRRLVKSQRLIGELRNADAFFQRGIVNMTKLERVGIRINIDYCKEEIKKLEDRKVANEKEVKLMPECLSFKAKKGKEININSADDIRYVLFDILKLKGIKQTTSGKKLSADADVLQGLNIPFASKIVDSRRLKKIQDYLTNFVFLADKEGRIHPSFPLHRAKSLRSSSSDPNFQNIPKHDEEAKRIIRTGIIPSSGRQFLATDYGSMEVRIWCCYTKDPVLTKYLEKDQDMHGEWGEFFNVSRYDAKNAFVFPLIYGSYYKSIYKEFVKRGYTHLSESKVRQGEDKFWQKYSYSKEWLERITHHYNKTGEVETKFGFKFTGLMTRNMIANYPIQSAAFHLLLWSLDEIDKIQRKEKWESQMIAQIHDEILQDAVPYEKDRIAQVTEDVMTKKTRENFDWIHIPLLSEFSLSDIDGSWNDMKKQDLIDGMLYLKKEKK